MITSACHTSSMLKWLVKNSGHMWWFKFLLAFNPFVPGTITSCRMWLGFAMSVELAHHWARNLVPTQLLIAPSPCPWISISLLGIFWKNLACIADTLNCWKAISPHILLQGTKEQPVNGQCPDWLGSWPVNLSSCRSCWPVTFNCFENELN